MNLDSRYKVRGAEIYLEPGARLIIYRCATALEPAPRPPIVRSGILAKEPVRHLAKDHQGGWRVAIL